MRLLCPGCQVLWDDSVGPHCSTCEAEGRKLEADELLTLRDPVYLRHNAYTWSPEDER